MKKSSRTLLEKKYTNNKANDNFRESRPIGLAKGKFTVPASFFGDFDIMTKISKKLASEIHSLADVEKHRLVDAILTDPNRPNPEIDRVW